METTALVLAYVGVALMVGLAGVASSIGTAITGQAAVGAMKKNGGAFGSYMILSALPGSQGLYGFVCFFLVQKGLTDPTMVQGAAIFGAGLLVGLVNIAASIYQAKVVRQRSVYLVHNASIPVFASMVPADRRYTVNHQARQAFRNNR